ncbi:MAG: LapA family protein [Deltaproteobacteria bacterium]|jgi:lipopolysaccharide assembly protein A|nr:LapA family protein [Deltaproteobacteria bacterium]
MSAKFIGIIVLLVVMVIFAIQNTQSVVINFLFWGIKTSAVLSILASFMLGFLVGVLVLWAGSGRKKEKASPSPASKF